VFFDNEKLTGAAHLLFRRPFVVTNGKDSICTGHSSRQIFFHSLYRQRDTELTLMCRRSFFFARAALVRLKPKTASDFEKKWQPSSPANDRLTIQRNVTSARPRRTLAATRKKNIAGFALNGDSAPHQVLRIRVHPVFRVAFDPSWSVSAR